MHLAIRESYIVKVEQINFLEAGGLRDPVDLLWLMWWIRCDVTSLALQIVPYIASALPIA